MKLSAILLARAIAFLETSDLNPRGSVYFPALVPLIAKRFSFQKFPSAAADFDEQKGVDFLMGYSGTTSIDKLTIWQNGIGIDVRSSSDDAKNILETALEWLRDEVGLRYERGMIRRWAYLSQVTFYSETDFFELHPAITKLCDRLSAEVGALRRIEHKFRPIGFSASFDKAVDPSPIAGFVLQRRVEAPFEENKFFAEAPLPSDRLILLLEDLEKDFLGKCR